MKIFPAYIGTDLVEAPAEAGLHGDGKGGLGGLVGKLCPPGGDYEALVVGSGGNLDFKFNVVNSRYQNCSIISLIGCF